MFGNAKYMVNKTSQERLRLPCQLPAEEDLNSLKNYTLQHMKSLKESEKKYCTEQIS